MYLVDVALLFVLRLHDENEKKRKINKNTDRIISLLLFFNHKKNVNYYNEKEKKTVHYTESVGKTHTFRFDRRRTFSNYIASIYTIKKR